ncbi:MAG: polyribonucleotide nucleotidyltransferase [Planctomycetaceae bacterium]|nr:polyribonucleotide nucleotidyltransferase [Planctomycetaceae bacterium]
MKISVEREIAGRLFRLTTGEMAKQASGAVLLQLGETVLFVAAQGGPGRPGIDFFPLQVDYRERLAAAGKFAGGFLKREGRPSTKEILTCRLTDRPIRPLFPKGYREEVQIMANVLASDGENDPDVLAITGASASLGVSPIPFNGPIAGVRVGKVDGELVLFPTVQQMETSTLDLIVAGTEKSVLMIEGFAEQYPEDEMADAIMFGHRAVAELCELQREFFGKVSVQKDVFEEPAENPFLARLEKEASSAMRDAVTSNVKQDRHQKTADLKAAWAEKLFPGGAEETAEGHTKAQLSEALYKLEHKVVRQLILENKRLDGRKANQLRAVSCDVGMLPRVHGSALFTRGETQALATVALGTVRDQQRVDGLFGEKSERFMLHYYFPSYSVGEVRPIRGPGRREIGHGCLAERSVAPVLPADSKFPYTIRVISDIMESNGSSSMASVCGATLSLMDAGVPITQPVAGISIGIIKESDDKYLLLTDIMGDEDHHGDMDFKVAGTQKGVTGIQLDLKIDGISEKIIRETLVQAKEARIDLLRTMLKQIPRPRRDISESAPRLKQMTIDPEKIGLLIGPGGKTIRAIQDETGASIDIQDDGRVTVSAASGPEADAAIARIEALTEEIRVGRIYTGRVSSVKDFGAFIEIAPGKDGLCHISELSDGFVKNVADVCQIGDQLTVKVIAVDDQNRVKLSRKAVLAEEAGDGDADGDEGSSDEEE